MSPVWHTVPVDVLYYREGDQQMIGRYIGILDTNHSSCCDIVKYYSKFLPIIVLSALLCQKTPFIPSVHAQVVNKGSPCLTLVVAFILDGVAMLSRIMEPCDSGGHAGCREDSGWAGAPG